MYWILKIRDKIYSFLSWVDENFVKFFIFVLLFKSFVVDISMVPSCSMTPTAITGDIAFVNKIAFGINRNSIQVIGGYLPFFKKKIFASDPKPGDPVIFTLPRDPKTIYFKRVIALEGDTVQMIDGKLYINDKEVKMELIGDFEVLSDEGFKKDKGKLYKMTLSNGKTYKVFRNCDFCKYFRDNTRKYYVPKGYVFAQGDNHTGSDDCFNMDFMGPIPVENIIGKPVMAICGSDSREENEPNWIAWTLGLGLRIFIYIYNIDTSRFFKKY